MLKFTTAIELRAAIKALKSNGKRIGFVPTMGAIHAGHLSLARKLGSHCDVRVCSIFVNPTQFNDPKDYEAYTINLDLDQKLLESEEVDILFVPSVTDIYPSGFQTSVSVNEISKPFEGALRPGHFTGVATVVSVLFNIVAPDVAIFGEKDFQQLRLIEQMVKDLQLDIEIMRGELIRDDDGLALSSRNARLTTDGRKRSTAISRGLFKAQAAYRSGERDSARLESIVCDEVGAIGAATINYVAVVDETTLARVAKVSESCRILTAVQIDGVRLLDNIALN